MKEDSDYDVRIFDSPEELETAIIEKASSEENRLSRIIASYDWKYKAGQVPDSGDCWGVRIGKWFKPWNYETLSRLSAKERKAIKVSTFHMPE